MVHFRLLVEDAVRSLHGTEHLNVCNEEPRLIQAELGGGAFRSKLECAFRLAVRADVVLWHILNTWVVQMLSPVSFDQASSGPGCVSGFPRAPRLPTCPEAGLSVRRGTYLSPRDSSQRALSGAWKEDTP